MGNTMRDEEKTRDQLIDELKIMRQRIAELEKSEGDRKQAEIALHESEAKFRALAENATAAIFVIQGEKYVYINPAFTKITGYTFEDLSSMSFWELIAPEMRELVRARGVGRQNKEDLPSRYDLKFFTKSGEERSGSFGATLIEFQNLPAILGTVLDITDRKKAEDLLRQAEEKYRNIFENSIMGIFQTTPNGRYLNANNELAWMLGYESPEEMIGVVTDIGQQQYVHPEDRMKLKELYACLGVVHRFETQMYRKDGAMIWISLNGRAVKGEDGEILCYEGTIEDITAGKQSELLMRIQYNLALALNDVTNLEDGLSLCLEGAMEASGMDCGGIYLNNPITGDLGLVCHRGLSPAFVESNSYFDANTPNTRLVMARQNIYSKYSSLGVPDNGVSEGLQAIAVLPIHKEDQIIGCLNVASHAKSEISPWARIALETIALEISRTISRLMVQSALKDSERRFRELADLLPQIVFELDDTCCITFMNRHALERYGYSLDDISQNPSIFSFLIPEDRERAQTIALRILKGEAIGGVELTALKKNGASFPVLVYLSSIESRNDIVGIRGIAIDMADYKMLEEQLHHAQKMQSIGTLAGGIAHDFNNLLTTILGCGQLLLMKTEFYGKTRTYLERIMEAAESAAQLTHDLLAFSRKQVAKPVVVDPSMIVDKIEKMAIRIIGENITLKVMHGGSDLRIMADINQMEQVLMNIIINARDAMPEGGVLTIRTEQVQLNEDFTKCHGGGKPGDYVRIAIIDNGIGMDSDTMERIFEPFFTTKDVGKGTGLGLSIVYGIIRKHNGYVTVSSEPEKGTTVEVYLPLADIADKIQATVPNAMHFERGKGTILIAEDDQLMLNMLKTILEEGGYKVIESVDGEDALQKYVQNKEKIDMVILDVLMPKKNAKAVYDVIKVMDPFQKVLFVSGYTPEDIEKSGIFREDFNLIRKPFLPDLLLRKVREVSAR
jgi:PAS domain S-box-containing protein